VCFFPNSPQWKAEIIIDMEIILFSVLFGLPQIFSINYIRKYTQPRERLQRHPAAEMEGVMRRGV
jgi:hypothetical protein